MSGKIVNFEDKKILKSDFYKNKYSSIQDEIDVDKILVSKKEPYGTNKSIKYFIGYDDDDIRPLCIKLPQMIGYVKCFDSNKTTCFKVPKENASYKCLSLIMVDSVIKATKKYYPQTLLEECKYEAKKRKMKNLINDKLESSSSDDETDNETESCQ